MSAQAQMFGPDVEAETIGKTRGPRPHSRIGALVPPFTLELLRAIFRVQRDGETELQSVALLDSEQAGEVLEKYVIESAPDVFGISLLDYTRAREDGKPIDLAALFAARSKRWPQ
jgi:hypothetical protein